MDGNRHQWLWVAIVLAIAYPLQMQNPSKVVFEPDEQERRADESEQWDQYEKDVSAGAANKKVAFLMIAATAGFLLLRAAIHGRFLITDTSLLGAAYVLLAAASFLWSGSPTNTMRELIRLSVTASLAFGLASNFSKRDIIRIVMAIMASNLVASYGLEIAFGVFRPWVGDHRMAGGLHPNTIGLHAAVLVLAATVTLYEHRGSRWGWFCLLLAMSVVLFTKSRTSLICAGFGGVMALTLTYLAYDIRRIAIAVSSVAVLLATVFMWSAFFGNSTEQSVANIASLGREKHHTLLTGRGDLWTECIDYIQDRPIFGHGYKGFWGNGVSEEIANEINFIAVNSHSVYVDALLHFGLVGLFLVLAIGATIAWRHLHDPSDEIEQRSGRAFYVSLVAMAAVHGFSETAVGEAWITGMVLATALFAAGRPLFWPGAFGIDNAAGQQQGGLHTVPLGPSR